jgi:hypothetical protein
MPTLLAHIAIAGLVCLAIVKNPKWVLLFVWVAILPDFDIFLGLHRIAFHTLFLLIPISIAVIIIAYRWFPTYKEPAFIIAFCLLSHTILDWLQYWNALFWPIPLAFWLNIHITILPTNPIPTPLLTIGPMIAPLHALAEPSTGTLFDPLTTGLFLLFLAVAIIRTWPNLSTRLHKPSNNTKEIVKATEPTDTDTSPPEQTHFV